MAPKVSKAAKTNAKAKPKPARGLKFFLEANDNVGEWVPITVANDMTAGEWLEVWAEQNGFSAVEAVPGGLTLCTMAGAVIASDRILSLMLKPGTHVYVEIGGSLLIDDDSSILWVEQPTVI